MSIDKLAKAMFAELDEHGYEDDDEKLSQVAWHFAEVAIETLSLTPEWGVRYRRPNHKPYIASEEKARDCATRWPESFVAVSRLAQADWEVVS